MSSNTLLPVRLIADDRTLAGAVAAIDEAPVIGVDTEFRREDTYYAQLCLLQISTQREIFLIDNLGIENLDPLFRILARRDQVKVMHSARQDLELLLQTGGQILQPVFDTQLAAACLGNDLQLGYSTLVGQLLDVGISKSQTRTQWCTRPLTPAQLEYAADDVLYLIPMMEMLSTGLEQMNRRSWFEEDSQELYRNELYEQPDEQAWQKVRGGGRLEPIQKSRLRALASWREKTAKKQDLPKQWVVRDAVLIELSRRNPATPLEMKNIDGFPQGKLKRYGQPMTDVLQKETFEPLHTIDAGKPTAAEKALLKELKASLKAKAEELDIRPELLAGKRDLQALASGKSETRATRGWRREILGKELLDIVPGEKPPSGSAP